MLMSNFVHLSEWLDFRKQPFLDLVVKQKKARNFSFVCLCLVKLVKLIHSVGDGMLKGMWLWTGNVSIENSNTKTIFQLLWSAQNLHLHDLSGPWKITLWKVQEILGRKVVDGIRLEKQPLFSRSESLRKKNAMIWICSWIYFDHLEALTLFRVVLWLLFHYRSSSRFKTTGFYIIFARV